MPAIYHITHLDNLAGIIGEGGLWSDSQRIRRGLVCHNIGHRHIKDRRLRRPVPMAAGGMLGDYVPFNFCYRSIMLYAVHRGHQDYAGGDSSILHLVSSTERAVATGRPWAFTDRHAELAYARYFDNLDELDEVDWGVMPLRYWSGDDDRKEKRQAEFLVHDFFPIDAFSVIAAKNRGVAERAQRLLGNAGIQIPVRVEAGWYYD